MKAFKSTMMLAVLFLALGIFGFTADLTVRVIASQANIRLKPDLQSAVVSKVPLGGVLDVIQKEGDWYQIELPPDENGIVVTGFIHASTVEVVKEERVEEKRTDDFVPQKTIVENEMIEKNEVEAAPSSQIPTKGPEKKHTFRAGLGITFPSADMAELFGLGLGAMAGNSFSIIRQPMFDFDLLAGLEVHVFLKKAGYTDIYWTRMLASGDGRFSFKINSLALFAQGGVALYLDILELRTWWWREEASKLRFGPRIGGGIAFKNFELTAIYHLVEDKMFSIMGSMIIKF
jgi:hypothetical protein